MSEDLEFILSVVLGTIAAVGIELLVIDGLAVRFRIVVLTLLIANLLVNALKEGFYERAYRREILKKESFGKLGENTDKNADEDAEKIADVEM